MDIIFLDMGAGGGEPGICPIPYIFGKNENIPDIKTKHQRY